MLQLVKEKSQLSKNRNLLFSKWFYYGLIAVALVIVSFFVLCESVFFTNDFAIRFLPTLIGLLFNFFIFIVFFDVREKLEWKPLEQKVKYNLKKDFFSIHLELVSLCGLADFLLQPESEYEVSGKFNIKKFNEDELEYLLKHDSIENLGKADNEHAAFFQRRSISMSDTLNRYGKFLEPKIQCSLMDLEDCLDSMSYYLLSSRLLEKDKKELLLGEIKKIELELKNLQNRGYNWMDRVELY